MAQYKLNGNVKIRAAQHMHEAVHLKEWTGEIITYIDFETHFVRLKGFRKPHFEYILSSFVILTYSVIYAYNIIHRWMNSIFEEWTPSIAIATLSFRYQLFKLVGIYVFYLTMAWASLISSSFNQLTFFLIMVKKLTANAREYCSCVLKWTYDIRSNRIFN